MYKFSQTLNKVGMKKEKEVRKETTERELELLEKLRQHPEILARVESILEIASSAEGPLKTADEVEELLSSKRFGSWAT